MLIKRLSVVLGLAVAIGFVSPTDAQTCVDTAGFVRTNGADTLVVEKVEATPTSTLGVQRSTDGVVRYHFQQLADTARLALEVWAPNVSTLTGPPVQSGVLRIVGTSAELTAKRGTDMQIQRNEVRPGAVPLLDVAVGLEERLVRVAKRTGKPSVDLPTFYVASDGYAPVAHVVFTGADSASVRYDNDLEVHFRIDRDGRVLGGEYRSSKGEVAARVMRVNCAAAARLTEPRR